MGHFKSPTVLLKTILLDIQNEKWLVKYKNTL